VPATFYFHGDLPGLLRRELRGETPLVRPLTRKASIKDVIESFGLPHTEVDRLECNGRPVDFAAPAEDNSRYDIHPVRAPWDVCRPSLLRPAAPARDRFVVDVNVGRLARYLRMAGFDTLYDHRWRDEKILRLAVDGDRIILTRDLGLLQRKEVQFGRYIRASDPAVQLREIVHLLGLGGQVRPFSRCLECNTLLQPVAKEEVLERLEPLTRKYYHTFSICPDCDRIYWPGSHVEKMRRLLPETPG
jgi:uncharacterized protein with PIN domain